MGAGAATMGGAGLNLYGAFQENKEAKNQAQNLMRDAETNAARMAGENRKFLSEQEMAYTKSGVILEGSPLLVLEETRKAGLQERLTVRAQARDQAQAVAAAGRARLLGALGQGMMSMGSMSGGAGKKPPPDTTNYNGVSMGGQSNLNTRSIA